MSQNDFNIANQGFPAFRADMNSAFQALASNSSGATAPSTTYAYQWWYDTSTDILKQRNAANDGWIEIAAFDQTNDEWLIVKKTSLTGSAVLPAGTTAQRDGSPLAGYVRFNSTVPQFEGYNGTTWVPFGGADFSSVAADIVPDADSTRDLGSASNAWAIAYLDAIEPVGTDTTIKRVGGTNSTAIVKGIAKAWVNFNGTGTIAVRDSFNVSSLTDEGVGRYSSNLTTAMTDTDYSVQAGGNNNNAVYGDFSTAGYTVYAFANTASQMRNTYVLPTTNGQFDAVHITAVAQGDLA